MPLVPFTLVSFVVHLVRYMVVSLFVATVGPKAVVLCRKNLPLFFGAAAMIMLAIFILSQGMF